METYYLIDFENVHNDGITNIENMEKTDHVHIFSTQNATNIRQDILWLNRDIKAHLVPARKQSLDMHLVSYLGYLLGIHGTNCIYVIVSKDKDYDNIVNFWKDEGYSNIYRKEKLMDNDVVKKETTQVVPQTESSSNTVNSRISSGMGYILNGGDRCKLNNYMQHSLLNKGYDANSANRVCKYVVDHCNDERMLSAIHNSLKTDFNYYSDVYKDVKLILDKFVQSESEDKKREAQVRSFFGRYFKDKVYVDYKENIIGIIVNAKSKLQVNNDLSKLYSDGRVVSHIYKTVQPLISDLPGR